MDRADCFFTMILTLAPFGTVDSRYDDLQLMGSCAPKEMTFTVVDGERLKVTTKYTLYFIPLPQRKDTVRLSYKMQSEHAHLGDCAYGLFPYVAVDSVCQRVMVRFGPSSTY